MCVFLGSRSEIQQTSRASAKLQTFDVNVEDLPLDDYDFEANNAIFEEMRDRHRGNSGGSGGASQQPDLVKVLLKRIRVCFIPNF